jgi:signal transduction histidine kinase
VTPRGGRPRGNDAALVRRAALRLGVQAAVGTAVVVALLVAVAVVELVRTQDVAADTALTSVAARADDVGDPPSGMWLVIRTANGTQSTLGLPAGLPVTGALDHVTATGITEMANDRADGRDFRVITERRNMPGLGQATVQAVLDRGPEHAQLASLLRALLIGGVVGLALAAVAGSWLARRAVRPLEAALGLQRRFVADASHELRTPLTLLSTRAQMLRRRLHSDADPTLRADVDGVVVDAERLAAILDDLLLAADPRTTVPDTRVDVAELAGEAVAAAAPAAQAERITISASATGWAVVLGSPAALRRALTALADNAIRHAATEVAVAVSVTAGSVLVEVTDDGPGIDEEMLPRIFERFASTDDGRGGGPRRYGLGLALVNEVVDRHGGRVSAANGASGGASFRLELPRVPGAPG